MLVLKGLVGLHRTIQLQLLQCYWLGHRLGLLWYPMVCLENEQRLLVIYFIQSINSVAAAAAKSLQSCPTLCDPVNGSLPGSAPGILQARTLEWVATSFSNVWKWKVKVKSLSRVQLFETPWTAAFQAPPSMGFSRQEDWSGVHCSCMKIRRTFFKKIKSKWLMETFTKS